MRFKSINCRILGWHDGVVLVRTNDGRLAYVLDELHLHIVNPNIWVAIPEIRLVYNDFNSNVWQLLNERFWDVKPEFI